MLDTQHKPHATSTPTHQNKTLHWLLEKGNPGARYLALRDLAGLDFNDAELSHARHAAHTDGVIARVLDAMQPQGYWEKPGAGYNPKFKSTVWSVILLAQLGARIEADERIALACDYVLTHTMATPGQFAYNGKPEGTFDCLQGNLCWALVELGCTDARLETAFDWMARSVTGDGIAPYGATDAPRHYFEIKIAPLFGCGINGDLSCAWGGAKVLMGLSALPAAQRTPQVEAAIAAGAEFMLAGNPANAGYPAANGKTSPFWWRFGFPVFYAADVLQNVEALVRLGYGRDARLQPALDLIRHKQNSDGRWLLERDFNSRTWGSFGTPRKPNKWVTLRALRTLQAAEQA